MDIELPHPSEPTASAELNAGQYREMVESVHSVILRWRADLAVEYINPFGEQLFGYTLAELLGRSILGTIVPDSESTGRSLSEMLAEITAHPERYANNENENLTKDGRKIWLSWSNCPVYGAQGELAGILSVGNDITPLKRAQADLKRAVQTNEMLLRETEDLNYQLARMASTDQLTGLLNRRSMMDKLAEEFFRAGRYSYQLGVLMIDIDFFKRVNDDFGHDVGDAALKAVATAIGAAVRADDTVARFGGEEICVILPYASRARCWAGGERIRSAVEAATQAAVERSELPRAVTVSIGGASTEDGAADERELLKQADEMLYHSKESGRNRVSVHGMD